MVIFINCIFCLCFAIDVPETYKFIRGQAEFIKDPNQSSYILFGKEVRYYAFDVFGDCLHFLDGFLFG